MLLAQAQQQKDWARHSTSLAVMTDDLRSQLVALKNLKADQLMVSHSSDDNTNKSCPDTDSQTQNDSKVVLHWDVSLCCARHILADTSLKSVHVLFTVLGLCVMCPAMEQQAFYVQQTYHSVHGC